MVAVVGTWTLDPEFPVEVRTNRLVRASDPRGGSMQRADIQQSVGVDSEEPFTRGFQLRFTQALKTEVSTYITLWETSARGALAINYTPPGGSAIPVRIVGSPQVTRTSPTRYGFIVSLEEVTNA